MVAYIMRLTILVVVLVALVACGGATATPPVAQQQTVNGLTIALVLPQATLNQRQPFTVTLTDSGGAPVEGADVYLSLDMTTDKMPLNQPIADALGRGQYRAETAYTMAGEWRVTVVAKVKGQEHRADFLTRVNS